PGCGAARSGAQLIRDRHALERSTQVGFTRLAHIGRRSRVNPRSVSAEKQENAGIDQHARRSRRQESVAHFAKRTQPRFWRNEPKAPPREGHPATLASRGPRCGDPMITGRCSWVPALATLGRDDMLIGQPTAAEKRRPAKVLCFA